MMTKRKTKRLKKLLKLSKHPLAVAAITTVVASVPISIYYKQIASVVLREVTFTILSLIVVLIAAIIFASLAWIVLFSRTHFKRRMINKLETIMVKLADENTMLYNNKRFYPYSAWDTFSEFTDVLLTLEDRYGKREFENVPFLLGEKHEWPENNDVPADKFVTLKTEIRGLIFRLKA